MQILAKCLRTFSLMSPGECAFGSLNVECTSEMCVVNAVSDCKSQSQIQSGLTVLQISYPEWALSTLGLVIT